METELIQALSNANINSDSAEIIASKYISYLYFSTLLDVLVLVGFFLAIAYMVRCRIRSLNEE
jgi:hypothetical protein